jgi:hypothetical protein
MTDALVFNSNVDCVPGMVSKITKMNANVLLREVSPANKRDFSGNWLLMLCKIELPSR